MSQNQKAPLRLGYTTGSCATAGAKAGLLAIIEKKEITNIDIILPKKKSINIKIHSCYFDNDHARCSVIKDGGDDPDVTHGAEIVVDLFLTDTNCVEIDGGEGVGIVTKPGLGLELNKAAINPVPKKMIIENLHSIGNEFLMNRGVKIVISVPTGRDIALKTDNPRLGIVGGISILGTSGLVIPFSTASFAASIRQNLDVVIAMGEKEAVLTTGGRSEDFSRKIIHLPDHCFVQMGDFSGYAIQQCSRKGIEKAYVIGFIGKLAKMAMGVKQTHVKGSKVDMVFLANLAQEVGSPMEILEQIKKANTARHVMDIIQGSKIEGFFDLVCEHVWRQMTHHSQNKVSIEVILFDFDGNVLTRYTQ